MSWNGSGTFNRIYSWVADKVAGLDISSSRMDTDTNDIASNGFGNCLTRDGQGSATANLPMNNFRHTGVSNGVARTDYAALGQVEDGLINWAVSSGTSDALAVTLSPAITSYADGQLIFVRATAANATTTPTLAVNGLTAETITKYGGVAMQAGDIPGNLSECIFRYNLANTRFELLNPAIRTKLVLGINGGTSGSITLNGSTSGSGFIGVTATGGLELGTNTAGQSTIFNDAGNGTVLVIQGAGGPVANIVSILAALTTHSPTIIASGSDTNINITVTPKGSGKLQLGNSGSFSANGSSSAPSFGGNTLPAAATSANVFEWLTMVDNAGNTIYIPAWH